MTLATANICNLPQTLSNIRNLTSSLFGIAAGALGLESYPGFAFYFVATLLTSLLIFLLRVEGKTSKFFYRPWGELWMGGIGEGLSSFVLTWTLVYGLVRA